MSTLVKMNSLQMKVFVGHIPMLCKFAMRLVKKYRLKLDPEAMEYLLLTIKNPVVATDGTPRNPLQITGNNKVTSVSEFKSKLSKTLEKGLLSLNASGNSQSITRRDMETIFCAEKCKYWPFCWPKS